jgi:UDP-GlcNAc:undecaprenyl-phosphate/decaprenyl-phosphate GlcNAc-1-phosphate transferase
VTGLGSALLLAYGGRPPEDPPYGGATRPPIPPAPPTGGLRAPHTSLVPHTAVDVVINAGLIAGGANLLNLFDLRPGRAIKVATASAALIAAGGGAEAVAAPLGAALALLPEDLGERAMLGDAGANALGAMLGAAAAVSLPRPARIGLLAGIVALTAASEKVSFTKVIERTPPLRWLDMLGRRPQAPAPPTAPQDQPRNQPQYQSQFQEP